MTLESQKGEKAISSKQHIRINGAISALELRVIDPDGNQIGVLSRAEALRQAELADLDLVEISPLASPPVARIVDWGKFKYQKMKEQQKNRKNAKVSELKQIRLGLKIGANDLDIKLRKVREFLDEGHKVKIGVFFRGREMAHQDLGYTLINKCIEKIQDVAVVDQSPQLAGKNLTIVVRSNNSAKAKSPSRNEEENKTNPNG